jgi:1A family penicillin-binding protein
MIKKSDFLSKYSKNAKSKIKKHGLRNILVFILACCIFLAGFLLVWVSTFQIPSLDTIQSRQVSQSTKIYDSTGQVLLYDMSQSVKRTVVPFDQISQHMKDATLSIEDKNFYSHGAVDWTSILRSILVDITHASFSQGGSTITQQVVKNAILTGDKTPARKLKEIVLSFKLEQVMSKDDILNMYLNEIPYGGSIYGVEEASETFFGISAANLDIAESAYLASLPQAPSYYSPYGPNTAALETRKNLVLKEMLDDKKITPDEYNSALAEKVTFLPQSSGDIKAPHFVVFVEKYLEQKYGADVLATGGLKVITTLNYDLQAKAEAIAKQYAASNQQNFNGSNDAFVAIDPKTGGILTMVGSRDFFDTTIDGQFNVATAYRQPGSTFKPFVYAEAFIKGYTPETVLFDVPTQFSTNCPVDNFTTTPDGKCYAPVNYDNQFRGPISLRDALAGSINVPSVKVMYLAGVQDSINLAESMGITSLGDANQYGLTLVLGGGEVSLLDMTSAYGVFATEGVRNPYTAILQVQDASGNILEEATPHPSQVLDPEVARQISDILNDNVARTPLYGANSVIYFPGRDVAVKTGTTNDYRDAWIIGYTPSVVVGAWAGNNDNTPMAHKISGLIVAPMWRAFMDDVLQTVPVEQFTKPIVDDSYSLKPVLRGKWQGGISTLIQNPSANPNIPYNSVQEILSGGVHSILYWLNKDDPRGPAPTNPADDPQFTRWEYGVRLWAEQNGYD